MELPFFICASTVADLLGKNIPCHCKSARKTFHVFPALSPDSSAAHRKLERVGTKAFLKNARSS
jgi:hypothetical protein